MTAPIGEDERAKLLGAIIAALEESSLSSIFVISARIFGESYKGKFTNMVKKFNSLWDTATTVYLHDQVEACFSLHVGIYIFLMSIVGYCHSVDV